MKTAIVALALSLTFAVAATAQEYERVLLPVVVQGIVPGAYGSLWVSEFTFQNASRLSVLTDPRPCEIEADNDCRASLVPAGSIVHFRPGATDQGRAVRTTFMLIPKSVAKEVHLRLTIKDISRADQSDGIELPIVRESEFRTEKISLLDIPAQRFRATLRIYNSAETPTSVRVRVFDLQATRSALVDRIVHLDATQIADTGHFLTPGFAELGDLITEALQRMPALEHARIEIDPAGAPVWAFVSITNNTTQQVSLVTPQTPL